MHFFWLVILLLGLLRLFCLVSDSSIVVTCPSIPSARFAFRLCFVRFVLLFAVDLSGEPTQNQGRGLVDCRLVQAPPPPAPVAGRPKAALLFWFFGDFRCGLLLFLIILVIYKYKNR